MTSSNGWETKRLGDPSVATIIMGQSPPGESYNKFEEGLPFFQGKTDFGETFPTATVWCTKPKKVAEEGDILLSVRAPVGPTNWSKEKCCIGRGLVAIRPHIEPKYVYYFLKFIELRLSKSGRSGIFNALTKDFLYNIEIPIPCDIKLQTKIVTKIEKIFSQIKPKTNKIIQLQFSELTDNLLPQSRMSLFQSAFEGKLTTKWRNRNKDVETGLELLEKIKEKRKKEFELIAKSKIKKKGRRWKDYEITIVGKHPTIPTWANAKLENLIYIAGRIGWKGLKSSEYTEEGPLFLSVYCLNYGDEVDYRDALHLSWKRYEESPEIQVHENDILLTKDGSSIGKIGFVKNLPSPATVNSSLLVIRSKQVFLPKFLFFLLSGPTLQNLARERTQKIAIPHLFQRDVKNFILPVPPISEQAEMVKILESKSELLLELAKKIETIKNLKMDSLKKLEMLPYSILDKAFSGRLVN